MCPIGSGGLFISSVICAMCDLLDINDVIISETGDCHDVGMGIWNGSTELQYYDEAYHYDNINAVHVIMTHSTRITHLRKSFPEHKIIGIYADEKYYKLISKLKAMKQYVLTWNKEIYKCLAGDDWPPYSKTNIKDSKMIREELINFHDLKEIKEWYDKYDDINVDFTINIKSVFGINTNLIHDIEYICGNKLPIDIYEFVLKYQETNKNIYDIKKAV